MAKQVNYAVYQQRLASLKEKTQKLLLNTGNNVLASQLDAELDNVKERKKLQLAFVGQYSSGKSTIISAFFKPFFEPDFSHLNIVFYINLLTRF